MLPAIVGTLLLCGGAKGQPASAGFGTDSLVFSSLTEDNGLSDNKVNCFFQDSKGFMWIGTADGLNRWDGSVFKVYRKNHRMMRGPGNNEIWAITEDPTGQLWIATRNGLSSYDPAADSFHTYRIDDPDVNVNLMTDLLVDKTARIWVATYKGLLCFDPRTHRFITYINRQTPAGSLFGKNNRINKIYIDSHGRFWLCTHNGLWKFDPRTGTFSQYMPPSGDPLVLTIYEDTEKRLWLGCESDGLQLFDPDSRTLQDIFRLKGRLSRAPSITSIKDREGHYYINAGVFQADPRDGNCQVLFRPTSPADVFEWRTAYVSRDNLLWWGTDKGIRTADPARRFFRHVTISPTPCTGQAVSLLPNGNSFYVGGEGKDFLKLYDSAFRLKRVLLSASHLPALLNIVREDDHHLWLCTSIGLYLWDERTGSYREYHRKKGDTTQPAMDFMLNLFIDSKGHHWVFPWRSGIWQLDKGTGRFTKIFTGGLTENNEAKRLLIAAALEDREGRIWFADLDEGLLSYDPRTGLFTKPTESVLGARYNLCNIVSDKDLLWGVTPGKVFSYAMATGEIRQWNFPEQYFANINSFCADTIGNLWIATRKGLLSFNMRTHIFTRWTRQDGLRDNDMTENLWRTPDGRILYTERTYFTSWDPAGLLQSNTAAPVLLTDVYSQNQRLPVHGAGPRKSIDLGHTYNNFIFQWAVQSYRDPLHNQYYYKLDGVDSDWKYAGNKGIMQYGGLLPGRYTFRMRGSGSNGVMNEAGDQLLIIIHPPFWKTGWFLVFASLSLLTAFVMAVRYISQRNLREKILRLEKEQAIDRERNRISQDMHDGLGSGLTKIAIMSEVAKQQLHEPEKARRVVEGIAESSRELVDSLQDIIWILNPCNDTLESLAAYIREYAVRYFEPIGIGMEFDYPDSFPEIKFSETMRRNIFLTVKESFHNTCKHAGCNKVRVSITCRGSMVFLDIKDDGKGFDTGRVRKFGNGLKNMQHRMQQVGGRCDILSGEGKGTQTIIGVPARPTTFV